MKAKKTKVTLYGDTIVEAVVAIAIYSIVAVLSLSLMSSGISTAQRNLESTMSRAVIDSESELLRYYYESYLASQSNKNDDARYAKIWEKIKPKDGTKDEDGSTKVEPSELYYEEPGSTEKYNTCDDLINHDKAQLEAIPGSGAAISIYALSGRGALSTFKKNINYYGIGKMNNNTAYESLQFFGADQIIAAPLYPRLTYKNMSISGNTIVIEPVDTAIDFLGGAGGKTNDGNEYYQSRVSYRAEGVWIFPKRTDKGYDFYVRTCWNPVGSNTPSTFMSVVRLYDAGA